MFQENEISLCFSDFTLMHLQISRIINLICFKVLRQSLMLLQITVVAVNRVKPNTLVCTLKLTFMQYPAIHTNYSLSNCTISN